YEEAKGDPLKLSLFIFSILLGSLLTGCSPVQFGTVSNPCTVNNPCINADGSKHVVQDVAFNSSNKVDILVIVDNSNSMSVEQQNLGSRFNGFIQNLNNSGLDWQIAITNTDVCPQPAAPSGFCPGPSGIPGASGSFMGPLGSSPMYGPQYIIRSSD